MLVYATAKVRCLLITVRADDGGKTSSAEGVVANAGGSDTHRHGQSAVRAHCARSFGAERDWIAAPTEPTSCGTLRVHRGISDAGK